MRLGDRVTMLISAPPFRISGWNRGREEILVHRVLVPEGSFAWGWRGRGLGLGLSLDYPYSRIISAGRNIHQVPYPGAL